MIIAVMNVNKNVKAYGDSKESLYLSFKPQAF